MSSFEFFTDLFGLDLTEDEPKKTQAKKESKKETKKTPEKKTNKKTPVKKQDQLTFPLTVLTGICKPTVLTKEQAGDADTLDKIADLICKQTGIPRALTIEKRLSNSKIAVILDRAKVQAKGEFDITTSSVVVEGEGEIALYELEGKRTAKEINDYMAKQVGEYVPYQFIADKESLYAIVGENVATGPVSLPVTIKSPLGDMTLGIEDFEMEDGKTEVDMDDVRDKVFDSETYQELESIIEFSRPSEPQARNIIYLTLKRLVRDIPKNSGPVKEMYPTNAVISLVFHRIQLSPEMFGGREEVEAKDIIEFLSKDYPEYTEARTKLSYDKEGNFIFPALKSSAKGTVTYGSREECLAAADESSIYFLANYLENGTEVRYEKTPVSVTEASNDGKIGRFQWKLPKIPKKILEEVRDFFKLVSDNFETEALVKVCYVPDEERYVVIVPTQTVSKMRVKTDALFLSTMDFHYVMDIHSHNTMEAVFSHIDDEDEKANGLYGVMGCFDMDEPKMSFRAATGGRYVSLSVSDIFTDDYVDEENVPLASVMFYDWYNHAVTFK